MRHAALLVLTALIAGCAAHPDPIIDTKGVDPERLAEDWDECEAYTEQINIGEGVAKGGALGGVVGAAHGAVAGDPARGSAHGVIAGSTRSGIYNDREKQKVFKRCLRYRGYRVLN